MMVALSNSSHEQVRSDPIMKYKDYYAELGVAKTASPAEIKKAYRALANAHHPDKSKGGKGGEERFKDINEANEVLSDPAKRRKYDQFGADWKHFEESGAQAGGFDWSKYTGNRDGQTHRTGPGSFDPASPAQTSMICLNCCSVSRVAGAGNDGVLLFKARTVRQRRSSLLMKLITVHHVSSR